MPWTFLLGLGKKLITSRAGIALFAAAIIGAGGWWYHHRVGALKSTIATKDNAIGRLQASNQRYQATVDTLQAQLALNDAATEALRKKLAAGHQRASTELRAIDQAPASDDGPVAPVLAHALDALRGGR